jgi:hypothetical protein
MNQVTEVIKWKKSQPYYNNKSQTENIERYHKNNWYLIILIKIQSKT